MAKLKIVLSLLLISQKAILTRVQNIMKLRRRKDYVQAKIK
jgi:hypothetical protein